MPAVRPLCVCAAALMLYTLCVCPPQEYVLTKKLLRLMLKRNAQQRISLSEVLQSAELRTALENPMGGMYM